ncbi:MAG: hypothetical protein K1X79_14285 [Oligoflexia bacterium]|nr:hypothetical protein [Oligoflexia bacterium]
MLALAAPARALALACFSLAFFCVPLDASHAVDRSFQNCDRGGNVLTCTTRLNQETVTIDPDQGSYVLIAPTQSPGAVIKISSPAAEEWFDGKKPVVEYPDGTTSIIDSQSKGAITSNISLLGDYILKLEHNPSGYTARIATFIYLPLGYVLTATQGSEYALIDPSGPNQFVGFDWPSFSGENPQLNKLFSLFKAAGADLSIIKFHNYLFSNGESVSAGNNEDAYLPAQPPSGLSELVSPPTAENKIDCSAPPCCCHEPGTGRSCASDKSDQLATIIVRIHGIYGFASDDKAGVWDEFYRRTKATRCVKVVDFEYKVDECIGGIALRLANKLRELCKNHCCKILVLGYCAGGVVAAKLAVNHNNSPTMYCSTSKLEIHTVSAPTAGFGAPASLPWLGCFQNQIGEGPGVGSLPDMGSSKVANGVSYTAHVDPTDSINGDNASLLHGNTQDPHDPAGANPQVTHTWGAHNKAIERVVQDVPDLIPYCPCMITPTPTPLGSSTTKGSDNSASPGPATTGTGGAAGCGWQQVPAGSGLGPFGTGYQCGGSCPHPGEVCSAKSSTSQCRCALATPSPTPTRSIFD